MISNNNNNKNHKNCDNHSDTMRMTMSVKSSFAHHLSLEDLVDIYSAPVVKVFTDSARKARVAEHLKELAKDPFRAKPVVGLGGIGWFYAKVYELSRHEGHDVCFEANSESQDKPPWLSHASAMQL